MPAPLLDKVAAAKGLALRRRTLEAQIPKRLLFAKGWPTAVPSLAEASRLAAIRAEIGAMFGMDVRHASGRGVVGRYEALLLQSAHHAEARARRSRST